MPDFDMFRDEKCRRRKTCMKSSVKLGRIKWNWGYKCNYYIQYSRADKLDEVVYRRMAELDENPTNTVRWRDVRKTLEDEK